ncbi:UNVERIFIED_CONTAM: hypothetical protein ABIC26_000199 [Paenibacillus sp. PvR008]
MERNQAERIVAELLQRADIGVTVKLEKRFPDGRLIGGKYAMNAHAADSELLDLSDAMEQESGLETRQRLALQIEENAWNYALKLVPEIEATFISAVIVESLLAYRVPVMEQSDIA